MSGFQLINFRQFFRDLRRQKLRTTLTTVGIFWGTLSVVLLFAVGKGLHEHFSAETRGLGDRIAIVWPGVTSKDWKGLPKGRRVRYTEEDIREVKRLAPELSAISVEYMSGGAMFKNGRNTTNASISGVWPEFGDMRNVIPQPGGRYLNETDQALKRRVVFLGDELATKIFAGEDPVGKTIKLNNAPFLVIGVMVAKGQNNSYSGRDKDKGFIPASTFQSMRTQRYPSNFVMQVDSGVPMKSLIASVHRIFGSRHGYDPSDTEALGIWDTTEGFEFFDNFFMAFRAFLVIVGCFTLITGGIGVANIMHVVVQERTKEIGIKMALGAHRKMVLNQFLAEALLLVAIGGFLGYLAAYGIISALPLFEIKDYIGTPRIDTLGAIVCISVLGVVGFIAGFSPARRAANMQPVQAIKLF